MKPESPTEALNADQWGTEVERFVNSVQTEGEALEAISRLRSRFDLTGTEFVKADVERHVRTALLETPETVEDFLTPVYVQEIMKGYYWKGLRDHLMEKGNEYLSEAISDTCGLPSEVPLGPEYGVQVASYDTNGDTLREVILKKNVDTLVDEVEQAKQSPDAVEVTINDVRWAEDGSRRSMGDLLTVWSI